jgi:hypothetical protein
MGEELRQVEVVAFGGLKLHFRGTRAFPLRVGATAGDLKKQLLEEAGMDAKGLLEISAVSTETEVLTDDTPVPNSAKLLFLLPPVSGG